MQRIHQNTTPPDPCSPFLPCTCAIAHSRNPADFRPSSSWTPVGPATKLSLQLQPAIPSMRLIIWIQASLQGSPSLLGCLRWCGTSNCGSSSGHSSAMLHTIPNPRRSLCLFVYSTLTARAHVKNPQNNSGRFARHINQQIVFQREKNKSLLNSCRLELAWFPHPKTFKHCMKDGSGRLERLEPHLAILSLEIIGSCWIWLIWTHLNMKPVLIWYTWWHSITPSKQ